MRLRTRSFLKVSQQVILDLLPKKRYCCLCESKYVILASQPNVWLRTKILSQSLHISNYVFATNGLVANKWVISCSQPNVWLRKISMSNDQETIDIMFATKRLDANKYRIHLYIHESTLNFPEKWPKRAKLGFSGLLQKRARSKEI